MYTRTLRTRFLGELVGKGRGQQMSNEIRNRERAFRSAENHALDLRPQNWLTPVLPEQAIAGLRTADEASGGHAFTGLR
jgi:hypothetical protein